MSATVHRRPGIRHIHTLGPGEAAKLLTGGDGEIYAVVAHPDRPPCLLRLRDKARIDVAPATAAPAASRASLSVAE